MLFLLTGECQIGKTRWLEALVGRLADEGVESYGVIAPGIWVSSSSANANEQGFEKLGIDNVLLPEGERIPFAKRRDLAIRDGLFQGDSQSEQLALGWHIFDEAIDRVNAHFDALAEQPARECAKGPSLLVVDELGRLELMRGIGLTGAVRILDEGPSEEFPHAIVVVREALLQLAEERFAPSWPEMKAIGPSREAEEEVIAAFNRQ